MSGTAVRYTWSGLMSPGTPFPAVLAVLLHIKGSGEEWATLYSAYLECGPEPQSGEGKLRLPARVQTDGWARILLHSQAKM